MVWVLRRRKRRMDTLLPSNAQCNAFERLSMPPAQQKFFFTATRNIHVRNNANDQKFRRLPAAELISKRISASLWYL